MFEYKLKCTVGKLIQISFFSVILVPWMHLSMTGQCSATWSHKTKNAVFCRSPYYCLKLWSNSLFSKSWKMFSLFPTTGQKREMFISSVFSHLRWHRKFFFLWKFGTVFLEYKSSSFSVIRRLRAKSTFGVISLYDEELKHDPSLTKIKKHKIPI